MFEYDCLDFDNVDDVFDFAIEKEKEAYDFYRKWAKKIEKPALREVFEEFAEQEAGHIKLFHDLKSGHTKEKPDRKVVDLHLADYLVEVIPSPDMDYREAVRVAIQREKAAVQLYSEFAKATGSPKIAATLEIILQEELKHKNRLETLFDDAFNREN
ncbi:MAG: ferritin family protein [Candidatus Krumholzibacteria bacterium]|jgi:rubrerythrin|nr:ferritin family protein [Candidatus Krumholzibacteria bacterium]